MSDDKFYRGDPPPGGEQHPSSGAAYPPPDQGAPGYGPPPGYGSPGSYGPPPGYGPPGYGPPGYPPPGYGYPRPTNTMAVLALVLAFVFAPAGLVLGIAARRQIARTGEEGGGLALAGIIVGGIVTGIYVLFILIWIIAFASLTSGSFAP